MNNKFRSFRKVTRFEDLIRSIQKCNLCPRMRCRKKVFSQANGSLYSKVLFIAEAPGRLGADKTGIPLHGDKTGDNFELLLGNIGWRREDIFVTNAILCNPRERDGRNATPSARELANCLPYLEMTLELLEPEVVITLGSIALKALSGVAPHGLILRDSVGQSSNWASRLLVPLYHPGPRAMVHRSLSKQRSDFMRLAKLVDPQKGAIVRSVAQRKQEKKLRIYNNRPTALQQVIYAIVSSLGSVSYFKLTKLLYLADLTALETINHTLTDEIYLRQPEGPWPPRLQKDLPVLNGYEVRQYYSRNIPFICLGPCPRFAIELDDKVLQILAQVLDKYRNYSNSAIKTAVYMTSPMRYLLSQEKQGKDVRKVPVIYKNRKAPATETIGPKDSHKRPDIGGTLFDINRE
jgi:uracil-DNA glycosylase family 4